MTIKKFILKTGGLVVSAFGLDKTRVMQELKKAKDKFFKLLMPGRLLWLKIMLVFWGPNSFRHGILTEYILLLHYKKINSRQFDLALEHYLKNIKPLNARPD